MKVLVTGCSGFIGSNLTIRLLKEGYSVVGLDNLSQGDPRNMDGFIQNPKFMFIKADILDLEAMKKAALGCEIIYHLAAFKIPRMGNAYDTLHINTAGTQNAILAAVHHKAFLIFSSTSDVYGKNPKVPFSEEHDLVLGPPNVRRWAYAISKAYDEQLCYAEAERLGLEFSIVRFFGGYGPGQNLTWWGGPQSVFINNALEDKAIPVHGDGKQTRSFTYVDDHVEGLKRVMDHRKAAQGEVFNLGNDREMTIVELAKMVWRLACPGSEPKVELVPYNSFGKYEDVMRRVPDITKSEKVLGFRAKWQLEDGLPITIEWQKRRRIQIG